jgi:tRNA/tmRNA/rRNA uracil-C5-methylase (TrmA/RlmC/RlmD family)
MGIDFTERCPDACRGCSHRHLDEAASLAQKEAWLAGRLFRWREVLRPIEAPRGTERWDYRDKVTLRTRWNPREGWHFGMEARDAFLPLEHCPVHSPRVRAVLAWLAGALPPETAFPLAFYVQVGAQASLILKTKNDPGTSWLEGNEEGLSRTGLEGLWLHLFPCAGRHLFGAGPARLLWGKPLSRNALGLLHGPRDFQQVVPWLYARSLDMAEAFLEPAPGTSVIDLYCGGGASLARWTARGARALGVELSGEALASARMNAPGATFLRGLCALRIPQLEEWIRTVPEPSRLLYANPPRTGFEPEITAWITGSCRPEKIAYLSCSAGTLARDLETLAGKGYRVLSITPYDFFPQTRHVETLAFLERTGGFPSQT